LEEDGFINRRPGVGTFVMSRPRVVRNPLEVNFSVTEIIESMGATPGALDIKVKYEKADSYVSKKLEVPLGAPIILVERTRTANGKPVVYGINIISKSVIGNEQSLEEFEGSFYELLEKKYNQKIGYSVAKIIPTVADGELSNKLKITSEAPLLLIEQVTCNENAQPILYAREYWIKNAFEFTILRRPKAKSS
jgi:GntR family transcriptional regulator